jgi:hypothetical protein
MKIAILTISALAMLISVACSNGGHGSSNDITQKLENMKTPAEVSDFSRTSSSQEVINYCKEVADLSGGRIRVETFGFTPLGKPEIVMIMGLPAPEQPEKVSKDKVVAYVQCNIHSGEVEGKEAALIFAREVAQGKHDDILSKVVILINPNMNADGNDNLGENRLDSQPEPRLVGTRSTAEGLNLNRDFTKLEAPETLATMKVLKEWKPVLFLDAHTTDGSRIRHAVEYSWSFNANTDKELTAYNSQVFIQAAMGHGSMLDTKFHRTAVPYGNFFKDDWDDNPYLGYWAKDDDLDLPRYIFNYVGLRGMVTVLLECYSWDPFKTRVETQYACIYGGLKALATRKDEIVAITNKTISKETDRAKNGLNGETVTLKTRREVSGEIIIDSYVYVPIMGPDGVTVQYYTADLAQPTTYTLKDYSNFVPTIERRLPAYYFIPKGCNAAINNLGLHDIEVFQLKHDVVVDVEVYKNFKHNIDPKYGKYEGHTRRLLLDGTWETAKSTIPAGTFVVSTSQRHGKLAGILLEPECDDGLASWNYFDSLIDDAAPVYPVKKSMSDYSIISSDALALVAKKPY